MNSFNYSSQGRRPSARQIVKDWKESGRPFEFSVEYGETYALFEYPSRTYGFRWFDSGNGCRGVDRTAVVKLLNAERLRS